MRSGRRWIVCAVAAALLVFGSSFPAAAGWRKGNIIALDNAARACTNQIRFSLAHWVGRVKVKVVNRTPEPDVVVSPTTQYTLPFNPIAELLNEFSPYYFARNFALPLSPQPDPGDQLRVVLRDVGDDEGADSSHDFTVVDCTETQRFAGFFAPVGNPPTLNPASPSSQVKVKFSLLGDQGLDIFKQIPRFAPVVCDPGDPPPEFSPTAASGTLKYVSSTDTYVYTWNTPTVVAAGCYSFWFRAKRDELTRRALFDFR